MPQDLDFALRRLAALRRLPVPAEPGARRIHRRLIIEQTAKVLALAVK